MPLKTNSPEAPLLTVFPADLASFLELIRQNGDAAYSLMFGYALAHALLIALFAGYAAAAGAMKLSTLIVVCWAGTFLGDVVRFWIGRRYGMRLFKSYPRIERALHTVARLTESYSIWLVLFHRYPYVIRGAAGFAYGMSNLSWPRFLVLNLIAAGLWACSVVLAGYAFGRASEKLLNDASSGLGFAMLVLFLGTSWLLSKKLEGYAVRD